MTIASENALACSIFARRVIHVGEVRSTKPSSDLLLFPLYTLMKLVTTEWVSCPLTYMYTDRIQVLRGPRGVVYFSCALGRGAQCVYAVVLLFTVVCSLASVTTGLYTSVSLLLDPLSRSHLVSAVGSVAIRSRCLSDRHSSLVQEKLSLISSHRLTTQTRPSKCATASFTMQRTTC